MKNHALIVDDVVVNIAVFDETQTDYWQQLAAHRALCDEIQEVTGPRGALSHGIGWKRKAKGSKTFEPPPAPVDLPPQAGGPNG